MPNTDNEAAMQDLAKHYAAELRAKFRTLSFFTRHGGEIGRVHEEFLAGCLRRFLPPNIRLGTGFVANAGWTSTQQDILLYDLARGPLLFETGSCVVVDTRCWKGSIAVKTALASRAKINDDLKAVRAFRDQAGGGFHGIYAWEGATSDLVLECCWGFLRTEGRDAIHLLPDAIHVSRRFVLLKTERGHLRGPPFQLLPLNDESNEGLGLLAFIDLAGSRGQLFDQRPWWLSGIAALLDEHGSQVDWPDDLCESTKI